VTIYEVTAWCSVPYYTTFEVEAATTEDALTKARSQARNECGEPCGGGESDWDEFEIHPEDDEAEVLSYLAPEVLARNAATELLHELQRGMSLAQDVIDSWERGNLAEAVRALSQWSKDVPAIIEKATQQ
jgi:hypothetical protein